MEEIIAPVDKELLKAELTEERRLRMTNRSHNQIYIVTAHEAPNTMRESADYEKLLSELPVVEPACRWT